MEALCKCNVLRTPSTKQLDAMKKGGEQHVGNRRHNDDMSGSVRARDPTERKKTRGSGGTAAAVLAEVEADLAMQEAAKFAAGNAYASTAGAAAVQDRYTTQADALQERANAARHRLAEAEEEVRALTGSLSVRRYSQALQERMDADPDYRVMVERAKDNAKKEKEETDKMAVWGSMMKIITTYKGDPNVLLQALETAAH
jgi:hypothetical protein